MKRTLRNILLLAALLTLPSGVRAGIEFGVVGGLNMSRPNVGQTLSETFDPGQRFGWYVGPKLSVGVLGAGCEIAALYNQRRLNLSDDYSHTFRSLEIPFNLKYTFGLSEVAALYVSTGPQVGFNIGDLDWETDPMSVAQSRLRSEFANVSWNIGIGTKLLGHVELGLSYNLALTNYARIKEWAGTSLTADNYYFKTNTFQVQMALLF